MQLYAEQYFQRPYISSSADHWDMHECEKESLLYIRWFKVYAKVSRLELWNVFCEYGVKTWLLNAIIVVHDECKACDRIN